MLIFVSYSYASMDNENPLFGNSIIDIPEVTEIVSEGDLRFLEQKVLASFGQPENFRCVVILNWKSLPEMKSYTIADPVIETLQK